MADGDTVKMRLTFWRDDKVPGDIVEVPVEDVKRWQGFAVVVQDAAPAPKTSGPTGSAPAAEWRTYAVSLGMDKTEADKASKAELQDFAAKAVAGGTA
jgi:hypothetical protein